MPSRYIMALPPCKAVKAAMSSQQNISHDLQQHIDAHIVVMPTPERPYAWPAEAPVGPPATQPHCLQCPNVRHCRHAFGHAGVLPASHPCL